MALAACASAPPMPPADNLFHDDVFAKPSQAIDPDAALAISPAMREYLVKTRGTALAVDRRDRLVAALYHGDLKLEYDADRTRTAAEAFDARSGNCLALVMMTAAFAKELGLRVRYQAVVGAEDWDRADQFYISIGHVNLVLEPPLGPLGSFATSAGPMVVDFLPPPDASRLRTRPIDERTVIAMYLNNRAVESLTRGQLADAYWWARESIRRDPELREAYVTLGVVYCTGHHPELAELALRRVTDREPDNLDALSNRILVLRELGRDAEARQLGERLAALDPHPPFSYFQQGLTALHDGRYEAARRLFSKEVERAPNHPEFEYWLAVSYIGMNDVDQATRHLGLALKASTTRQDHDLYAGKLDRLKTLRMQ
jgi:tetratricopeptide (TPR) repeat protein